MAHVPRFLYGLALSLLLAAPVASWLAGQDEHLRLLLLIGAAMVVALRPIRVVTDIALGTLCVLGMASTKGAWTFAFLGTAAAVGVLAIVWRRFGAGVSIGLIATAAVIAGAVADPKQVHLPVHTWNQFHYVLGTKYFDEVGYHDLYPAVLLADEDGSRHFTNVRSLRDMHSYSMMSRDDALSRATEEGARARFTDARWADFQHDLDVFYPMFAAKTWPGVFTDLGYNPSPVWVAIHQPLLKLVPLSRRALEGFALLQVPMYLGALGACLWAFGLRATLWIVLWNLLFFGSQGRLFGGYWSYDWLALVLVAAALVAKGRPALAAVPIAIGGLMRGFGGLLAVGPTVQWLVHTVRERRLEPWTTRFLGALALAMLGLVGVTVVAYGPDAWVGWYEKIELHSSRISTGGRHLGLKVLFGEDWSVPGHTADLDARREIYAGQSWAYHLVQGVLVVWTAWVARKRTRLDAALLGFIPAFALMVLSRYYYAAWSVVLLLGAQSRVVQVGMFAILALHEAEFFVTGTTPDSRHQDVNLLVLVLSVATLVTYTVRDWTSKTRRRA
jgi:hypothetical protein